MRRALIVMAAACLLAGCASRPAPAPTAAPAAPPAARQVAEPVVPPPAVEDWPDRPLSPGDWTYSGDAAGSEARFAGFGLRCDSARRRIVLFREGASGALRVRTSYGARSLSAGETLAPADPLLDEMAFSRGRFAVEADGAETLIVPAWAEPARVTEDCRG
jgi:hypothetical protein